MEKHEKRAVIFDSGIGGLNLLYECARRTPLIRYCYISDGEHAPYGNRSREEILALSLEALNGIEKLKPAAMAVACNTVTANCINELRARFKFPVAGIQPAVKQAALFGGRCLVLATNATVKSPAFSKLVASVAGVDARAVGCGGLAGYIEDNIFSLPEELPGGLLPDAEADCVVLGCTHYTFVKEQIKAKYKCPVFDGTGATADHFVKILGTADHFLPHSGKFDHFANKKFNITFLGKNSERNSQIFNFLFKTNV